MKMVKLRITPIALTAGIVGFLSVAAGIAYWQLNQRQWCVQFTSTGGQEVTYSKGCISPHRYKKWVITT